MNSRELTAAHVNKDMPTVGKQNSLTNLLSPLDQNLLLLLISSNIIKMLITSFDAVTSFSP